MESPVFHKSGSVPPLTPLLFLVAALYLARDLLIPFALAFVLTPMLVPAVAWLERLKLGRVVSVLIVITLSCAVLGTTTWFMTRQVADLVTRLPEYRANIVEKVQSLRGGVIDQASDAVKELGAEIETLTKDVRSNETDVPLSAPQEVSVVPASMGAFEASMEMIGLIFSPLGTLGLVLVLATFLLLQRGDLRDRVVHLMGHGNINLTTQAMDEIRTRISKYLQMQVLLNAIHGTVVGLVLWLLSVPNPLFWGLLSAVLRFVPYFGPLVATAMPIALALAVFDGWERPLAVAGALLFIELISNNVLEPWLYGSSAGVSSLAVIGAAIFWAWIWGPVGLVLATPMTVVLVVIGKHVPQFRFLNVLLGEASSVDPAARVYQRLLAMDQVQLSEITERALAEQKSFVKVCDAILIPALAMAEFDRHHGTLQDFREQFIEDAMRELIEDLGDQGRKIDAKELANPTPGKPVTAEPSRAAKLLNVLCIPARNELDQVASLMLCQALEGIGIPCRVASVDALASEKAEHVREDGTDIVCISAFPPSGLVQSRYLGKRLRARFPDLPIVVGLWGSELTTQAGLEGVRIAGSCTFATTLEAAREQVRQFGELVMVREKSPPPLETLSP